MTNPIHRPLACAGFVLLLCSFVGCENAIQPGDWKLLTGKSGRFSVEMPGEATHSIQKVPTDVGSIDMHVYSVERQHGNVAYMTFAADYPEYFESLQPVELFDSVQEGVLQDFTGVEDKAERDFEVQGIPGRELLFRGHSEGQRIQVAWQFFFKGSTLYQLGIVSTLTDIRPEDRDHFFNSMKFLTVSSEESDEPTGGESPPDKETL